MEDDIHFCDVDPVKIPREIYFIIHIIVIALQVILFLQTLYRECSHRNMDKYTNIRTLRMMFICMQLLSLLFQISDSFLFTIDVYLPALRPTFVCQFIAHSVLYFPGLFYGLYLYQIVLRMQISLKGSALALSTTTRWILKIMILLIPLLASTALAFDGLNTICFRSRDELKYCNVPSVSLLVFKYHIYDVVVLLMVMLNITFGVIFGVKLQKFIKMGTAGTNQVKQFKFKSLIIKNQILTIVGCVTTTFGFILYPLTEDSTSICIDFLVNCVVIGLMLKWNEPYYKWLCRPCICICVRCYSSNSISNSEVVAQAVDYLHSDVELQNKEKRKHHGKHVIAPTSVRPESQPKKESEEALPDQSPMALASTLDSRKSVGAADLPTRNRENSTKIIYHY